MSKTYKHILYIFTILMLCTSKDAFAEMQELNNDSETEEYMDSLLDLISYDEKVKKEEEDLLEQFLPEPVNIDPPTLDEIKEIIQSEEEDINNGEDNATEIPNAPAPVNNQKIDDPNNTKQPLSLDEIIDSLDQPTIDKNAQQDKLKQKDVQKKETDHKLPNNNLNIEQTHEEKPFIIKEINSETPSIEENQAPADTNMLIPEEKIKESIPMQPTPVDNILPDPAKRKVSEPQNIDNNIMNLEKKVEGAMPNQPEAMPNIENNKSIINQNPNRGQQFIPIPKLKEDTENQEQDDGIYIEFRPENKKDPNTQNIDNVRSDDNIEHTPNPEDNLDNNLRFKPTTERALDELEYNFNEEIKNKSPKENIELPYGNSRSDIEELEEIDLNIEPALSSAIDMEIKKGNADNRPQAILLLAYNAAQANQIEVALELYEKVLTILPDNYDALFGLATILHKSGQLERAKLYYESLIISYPENYDVVNNLLSIVSQESPEAAVIELEKLGQLKPKYAPIYVHKALAHQKLNEVDQAIAEMIKAINIDPSDITYRYNLAVILDKAGRYKTAARVYKEVINAVVVNDKKLNIPIHKIIDRVNIISYEVTKPKPKPSAEE